MDEVWMWCSLSPVLGQGHYGGGGAVEALNSDPKQPRPWPALTSHNQGNDLVRTEPWRYRRDADGSEELYDQRSAPEEWTNLVAQARGGQPPPGRAAAQALREGVSRRTRP